MNDLTDEDNPMSQKLLSEMPDDDQTRSQDTLELVQAFTDAWVSLDAYDTERFPKNGATQHKVELTAAELVRAVATFKQKLVRVKQASDLFGKERQRDALIGIFGNVFQTFDGRDLYPSVEEKAANLLYLIVKDHPFIDGNKRIGAFAFIWLLHKADILGKNITPQALAILTVLVAESASGSKNKTIGFVLLLLLLGNV